MASKNILHIAYECLRTIMIHRVRVSVDVYTEPQLEQTLIGVNTCSRMVISSPTYTPFYPFLFVALRQSLLTDVLRVL